MSRCHFQVCWSLLGRKREISSQILESRSPLFRKPLLSYDQNWLIGSGLNIGLTVERPILRQKVEERGAKHQRWRYWAALCGINNEILIDFKLSRSKVTVAHINNNYSKYFLSKASLDSTTTHHQAQPRRDTLKTTNLLFWTSRLQFSYWRASSEDHYFIHV